MGEEVNLDVVREALESIEALYETREDPRVIKEIFEIYGNKVDILPKGGRFRIIVWQRWVSDKDRKKYIKELLKTI